MSARIIDIPNSALEVLCTQWHIRRLSVFGSAIRADFHPDSDFDPLVEFQTGKTPGLSFFQLRQELSGMFGRQVDLNAPACLSPRFREDILSDAEDLYVVP